MPHILEDALDLEVMHSLRRLILKVRFLVYSAAAYSIRGFPISEVGKVNSNELCNI
jgi:hypothetical protein